MKFTLLLVVAVAVMSARSGLSQITVAQDGANFANYSPQPTHNWAPINGGFGYGTWTPLSDAAGGGTFMEGVGVNNRQVDSNYSFALYSGGGAFDISRPLSSSLTTGDFSVLTRFDLAGSGTNMVDLRTGNDTGNFFGGALLSFGIVNGNQLDVIDSTGLHLIGAGSGEARGSVWDWNVAFDAVAGTYTLSVTNLGGGFADTFSGSLDASSTSVGSFAVINQSAGGNQNLIFDLPTFAVPEPSSVVLGASGLAMLLLLRRRR